MKREAAEVVIDPAERKIGSPPPDETPEFAKRWAETANRRALSRALILLRRHAEKTQKELADAMGKDQAFVSRMESATAPWPKAEYIALYAQHCGYLTGYAFVDADRETGHVTLHDMTAITRGKYAVEVMEAVEATLLYDHALDVVAES